MFSPSKSLLFLLEEDLDQAVIELNMDFRAKIRDALEGKKAKSGMDSMGNPFVDLPGKHVVVSPDDTVEEIARKIGTSRMSITGAAFLAGTIKDRINAAKAKVEQVSQNTDSALVKLNEAADKGDRIAKQIEAEAADLQAQLGQWSNE